MNPLLAQLGLDPNAKVTDYGINPKKATPPPSDYTGAAEKQQQSDFNANRPDQTNAFGSNVNWTQNPDGTWSQSQNFGGQLGGIAQGLQGQAAQSMANPFTFEAFGSDGSSARDQAIQAAYSQATSRLDPQWNQRGDAMRTQLLNQGLDQNSEAYRNAMGEFDRSRNDAYGSAMNSAIGQGQAAGDSVFRNDLMAHQQVFADAIRGRQLPMEELSAMSGFLGQAGFQGVEPAQHLAAAMGLDKYKLEAMKVRNKAESDTVGSLFKLATSIFGGGQ